MKATIRIICLFLSLLALISCQQSIQPITPPTSSTSDIVTTASADNTETKAAIVSQTTSAAVKEPHTDGTPSAFEPGHTILGAYIYTVRWGNVLENDVFPMKWDDMTGEDGKAVTDENGSAMYHVVDLVAVEVEVLEIFQDLRGAGEQLRRSNYLWVPTDTLSSIVHGETALVFAFDFDFAIAGDSTEELSALTMKELGSGYATISKLDKNQGEHAGNLFPIKDGRIRVEKQPDQQWEATTDAFFEWNDIVNEIYDTATPRFRDGMTLEEFDQMIDLILQYVKR